MSTLQERLLANPLPLPNVMELCREAADRIEAGAKRIKELEGQIDRIKDEWLAWDEKRKALEADAERYRWLRDVHTHHYTVTRYVGGATIPRFEGAQLDAAIDAARSKT